VADAYYVLSDPTRRKEYDILLSSRSGSADPSASADFFSEFAKYFSGAAAGASGSSSAKEEKPKPQGPGVAPERPDADYVFTDVFEELLRPEVEKRVPWWTYLGMVSGAGLGMIIANLPGKLTFLFGVI
jgi:curved DNA-binding protein CbpA